MSGRDFDDDYDESEYASGLASIWQPTAAHHVNAQQASTSHHVNAQSAANPSMIDADTQASAFTQYASASMTGGASHNVSQRKALAVAKSEVAHYQPLATCCWLGFSDFVLTRQSGHTVHPDKVCLTVTCMHAHPVQGLASLRTLDYNNALSLYSQAL